MRTCPDRARLLEVGETIVADDLYFDFAFHQTWRPVRCSVGQQVKTNDYGKFCRFLSVEALDKAKDLPPFPAFEGDTTIPFRVEGGTNPKDAVAAAKPDLYLVPPALMIWVAKCMENGAKKYSKANWRDENQKVRMTVYISAALRHLLALSDGEDCAPDTGLPHAAHAAASLGIILDALACGTLIDDRSKPGPAAKLLEQLTEKTK